MKREIELRGGTGKYHMPSLQVIVRKICAVAQEMLKSARNWLNEMTPGGPSTGGD